MRGMMPVLTLLLKIYKEKARSKRLIVSIVTLEKECCAMRAWLSIEALILRVAGITPTVPILAPKRGRQVCFESFHRAFERVKVFLKD